MSCRKTQANYRSPGCPFAFPTGFVQPRSVGNYYATPVPSYPILPPTLEQLWTPRPSYLNAIANDPDHPLHFMGFNNLQRY